MQPQNQFLDLYRTGLRATTDFWKSSFDEVTSAQARLATSQMERTLEFWNSLWRAATSNAQEAQGRPQESRPPERKAA